MTDDMLSDIAALTTVPEPKTTRYHIGIYEDNPPVWFIPLAGVTFPVTTSKYDAADREIRMAGTLVDLTVEQVKAVKTELINKIVRWRKDSKGKIVSAEIFDRRVPSVYRPARGDEPLAKYVYFRKAPPEIEQPKIAENTFAAIESAIREAEAGEERARQDPEDAKVREVHGAAKKAGRKLSDDSAI